MKKLTFTAAAAPTLIAGTAANAAPVRMEVASLFPSSQPLLGSSGVAPTEAVTAITGGDVEMRFYEPNTLVPPFEDLDAVGAGTADAAWTNPSYNTKKDIAFAFSRLSRLVPALANMLPV